ncbi:acyl-CoA dehydrogenase family protein [uncultured Jatrophihabitans sp.]|uniref:acyl-CoA dehydrogenase family protein n=1 Tax=uncultured Jatrophihabitans sp. TaxID=1610747 RepID=UPI0035CB1DDA
MTFALTEEHAELRASVRRFLTDRSPVSAARRYMTEPGAYDEALWTQMADQLGLPGLAVAEEYGGSGYGTAELAIVLEELGSMLYVGPYFATVALAGQTLAASEDAQAKAHWLPGIADGTTTAALAVGEGGRTWVTDFATRATAAGDGWTLDGTKRFVIDGATAGLLLVFAATDDGVGLFALDRTTDGVQPTALDTLDLTRRLADVTFTSASATRIGGEASELLAHASDLAVVALAAEQVGGTQHCLDETVEYAKLRVQFGRKIGSFQAVKHRAADVLLALETARSAMAHAAAVVDAGGDEAALSAALAASLCSEAFTEAARANIQLHGGIGFTWEHDAHLYLKRAKSDELLFGAPVYHRMRLGALTGITG